MEENTIHNKLKDAKLAPITSVEAQYGETNDPFLVSWDAATNDKALIPYNHIWHTARSVTVTIFFLCYFVNQYIKKYASAKVQAETYDTVQFSLITQLKNR